MLQKRFALIAFGRPQQWGRSMFRKTCSSEGGGCYSETQRSLRKLVHKYTLLCNCKHTHIFTLSKTHRVHYTPLPAIYLAVKCNDPASLICLNTE